MRTRAGLPVVAVAAAVAALTLASPAQAAFPGKNGRIAFTVEPRDRAEAVSSTIETVLPDGRFIAFIRSGDLYVMRSDGSRERKILDDGLTDSGVEIYLSAPSWQPLPR